MKSAVLLVVYNRPEKTRQVFEQIRLARPARLYVVADGPLPGHTEDEERCRQVRGLVEKPDWDCHFESWFRDENIGCGPSVKEAIDWFFTHEEEGIILEDDTVPDPSFFRFCDEMLDHYRNERHIAFISGTNHQGTVKTHVSNPASVASYFFARNKTTWGWATWRRAWELMDYEMTWLQSARAGEIIRNMSLLEETSKYWMNAVMSIQQKNVSAWDWQWYFSVAAEDQLVIYPAVNLVSNIGFGPDATHTTGTPDEEVTTRYSIDFPLHHPQKVVPNDDWDRAFETKKLQIRFWVFKKHMPVRMKRFIRKKLRAIRSPR